MTAATTRLRQTVDRYTGADYFAMMFGDEPYRVSAARLCDLLDVNYRAVREYPRSRMPYRVKLIMALLTGVISPAMVEDACYELDNLIQGDDT